MERIDKIIMFIILFVLIFGIGYITINSANSRQDICKELNYDGYEQIMLQGNYCYTNGTYYSFDYLNIYCGFVDCKIMNVIN